jgi:hypothetical protein
MLILLRSSFRTCLGPGGVEGANRNNRRLGASVWFAPMPCGTDTVGPARQGYRRHPIVLI